MGKTFKDNRYKDHEKQSFKDLKKQWKNEREKKQQDFNKLRPFHNHDKTIKPDNRDDEGRDE